MGQALGERIYTTRGALLRILGRSNAPYVRIDVL
jgi:hypothetical protein